MARNKVDSRKNFIVDFRVYPFQVMVSIDQTDEELLKAVKKTNVPQDEYGLIPWVTPTQHGKAIMFSNGAMLLRLKEKPYTPYHKACLAHEVFHIVSFLMDRIGMEYHDASQEAFAYCIQYLTQEIYENC